MWEIEEIAGFGQLPPADQLWLIAVAVEENGGPAEYVWALRRTAERLEELGWWLMESRAKDMETPTQRR